MASFLKLDFFEDIHNKVKNQLKKMKDKKISLETSIKNYESIRKKYKEENTIHNQNNEQYSILQKEIDELENDICTKENVLLSMKNVYAKSELRHETTNAIKKLSQDTEKIKQLDDRLNNLSSIDIKMDYSIIDKLKSILNFPINFG